VITVHQFVTAHDQTVNHPNTIAIGENVAGS
jgi:hypothetical protein